jgi:3-deoxy-D-manno-octulosonic-acid transferase
MPLLYRILLSLYETGILVASRWNPKAGQWVQGRKNWEQRLIAATESAGKQRIWMHCASLGEFEQGRPVLETLRKNYPHAFIVLSFFSPSGYEIRKNYPGADYICYLPMDNPTKSKSFVQILQPGIALFVKYEFWHYYLKSLKESGAKTLLISAIFRPGQAFFKPWGGFWRQMLQTYEHIFVQDESSLHLLEAQGLHGHCSVAGDTRFDRVLDIASAATPLRETDFFCAHHQVIVAGSTWPEDEEILAHYARVKPGIRFVIAPHEIHDSHIRDIQKLFPDSILFSQLRQGLETGTLPPKMPHVLIINNMGMLSRLYRYAQITYVGGGFGGAGIHNILEAAVYAKPVLFGPVHYKSREARQLLEYGGAFTFENALEAEKVIEELLENPEKLALAGNKAGNYVRSEAGATEKILAYIQENRLLIS